LLSRACTSVACRFSNNRRGGGVAAACGDDGINLSHVSLVYRFPPVHPPAVYSLRDVTINHVPRGSVIGLAGRSGAGKSSLFNALLGLADRVEAEAMTVDGVDLGKMSRRDARLRCLVIPQQPPLFKGTWRYNLSLGTIEAMTEPLRDGDDGESRPINVTTAGAAQDEGTERAMREALRLTGLEHKLDPKLGLDTLLDESGSNFSAGERQLFCFARALMRQPPPPLVLLDEVTAHVDDATDRNVQRLIREEFVQRGNCIVLMIAHRESSLGRCDVVFEFGEGKVIRRVEPL
jgi:ABC-type multidrug transport system fused ATPase/permease subunit